MPFGARHCKYFENTVRELHIETFFKRVRYDAYSPLRNQGMEVPGKSVFCREAAENMRW